MPKRENDKNQSTTKACLEYIVKGLIDKCLRCVANTVCGNKISASKTGQMQIKNEMANYQSLQKSKKMLSPAAGDFLGGDSNHNNTYLN
jgi:hypothetical protein